VEAFTRRKGKVATPAGRLFIVAELLIAGSLLGIASVSSDTNRRLRYSDVELHPAVTSAFFNWNPGRYRFVHEVIICNFARILDSATSHRDSPRSARTGTYFP
jgi:hypothetical protein